MAWKFVVGALAGKLFGLGESGEALGCGGSAAGSTGAYTIKPGDTLTSIANAHGTSVKALLAANPSIEDPDLILAGATLNIPGGGKAGGNQGADNGGDLDDEELSSEGLKQAAEAAGGVAALKEQVETYCTLHTCAGGDTLTSIAVALGACPQMVTKLNPQVQDPAAPLAEGTQVLVPSAQALQNGMGCAGGDEDGDEGMGGFFGDLAKQIANHAIDQLPI